MVARKRDEPKRRRGRRRRADDEDPLSLRRNRLFFLGASFSDAAGIPLTSKLLASTMQIFEADCPGIFENVDGKVRHAFGLDRRPDYSGMALAEICTLLHYHELGEAYDRWSNSGSRELLALRFYLAKAIAMATPPEIPSLHHKFATGLHPGDMLVSFNWDCLLEAALDAAGVPWHYHTGKIMDAVQVYKLHGSINWRRGDPEHRSLRGRNYCSWRRLPFFDEERSDESVLYASDSLVRDAKPWSDAQPLTNDLEPFLVLPGYGKAVELRVLAPLWHQPGSQVHFTGGGIFVIGLSLARDDFIIQALFRDSLQHVEQARSITIINPDPRSVDNYSFLVGRPNVRFLCEPFALDHVAGMGNRRMRDARK